MPKATLIYNPRAGPVNLAATIERVADFWCVQGWRVEIQFTQARGHATTLAYEAAAAGNRLVLAAGGDGTLGEVANGLAGTASVMAPLPVGTANSFARELQMPLPNVLNRHKLLEAAEALAAGRVHALDLGYTHGSETDGATNGRYWLLWTGAGADGFLVSKLEPRPKLYKKLGAVGYALQAMTVAPRFPTMRARVDVDGRVYDDDFVLVLLSNCRLYGGGRIVISPQAQMDDGQFEVWLFQGSRVWQVFDHAWQAWRQQHHQAENVTRVTGRCVTVTTDPTNPPMPYQTDGEKAGATPFTCEMKPKALRLLVPDTAPADLFSQPGEPLEIGD